MGEGQRERERDRGRGRDYFLKIYCVGTGEVAQPLGALTALTENPTIVASTHVGQIRNTCNSSFQESDALFLPLQALNSHVHITRNRYMNKNNN